MAGAAIVEEETQIRSPRHLQALLAACAKRGVEIAAGVAVHDFKLDGDKIAAVRTNNGDLNADQVVLAAGAWSQAIAERLNLRLPVKPIRGQIVLLKYARPILNRVINFGRETMLPGRQYFVPRDDGRILVGSTLEDVGFDRRTTAEVIANLLRFAVELAPELKAAEIDRCWAGFRPSSVDDLPYLGRIPGLANAFVASGHYRAGLYLAPGTAVVMSRLIRGEAPGVDLSPFRPDRTTPA